jgi:hypothetical protein
VRSNRGQKPAMRASHDQADKTRRVQVPPTETGPVPVSVAHAETRWFGVPPPLVLLVLTVGCAVAAIALLADGNWTVGLFLLALSALLAAAFLEVAHRRPDSALTRASAVAALGAREWASWRLELLRAKGSAVAGLQRVEAARSVIESERRAALLRLGEAVQSGDDEAEAEARRRLRELAEAEKALEGRLQETRAQAEERIQRIRLSGQQTMVVEPEPYPPPDEGDPPVPAPIPEPYPPPDEDSRRPAA